MCFFSFVYWCQGQGLLCGVCKKDKLFNLNFANKTKSRDTGTVKQNKNFERNKQQTEDIFDLFAVYAHLDSLSFNDILVLLQLTIFYTFWNAEFLQVSHFN